MFAHSIGPSREARRLRQSARGRSAFAGDRAYAQPLWPFAWFLPLCLLAAVASSPTSSHAQSRRITHIYSTATHDLPQLGREYWFPIMTNGASDSTKAISLLIGSTTATNVHVQITAASEQVYPVAANKMLTINVPLSWESKASALIEKLGVHVWSGDAFITCAIISHVDQGSTDGTMIIPASALGTDYVVAAAEAPYDSINPDYPSIFEVVALKDRTVLTITPTADIRRELTLHSGDSTLAHAKGVTFTDTLDRGQTIQYKTLLSKACTTYDLTGTIIRANAPVGVTAGAARGERACHQLGADGHTTEMLAPTNTWGRTYYVHRDIGNMLRMIGTKPNQLVRTYDTISKSRTLATLTTVGTPYSAVPGWYFRIESDTSFQLSCFGTNMPDGINGPMEMLTPVPVEAYQKQVTFLVDSAIRGIVFSNTLYVFSHQKASYVLLDGKPLAATNRVAVDQKYYAWSVGIKPGLHTLVSDSGLTAQVSGVYASDIYGWTATYPSQPLASGDLTPPYLATSESCFTSHVSLSDTMPGDLGLQMIIVDSGFNFAMTLDPKWVEGSRMRTSYYDLRVIDSTQPAQMRIRVIDAAGNATRAFSEYVPTYAFVKPYALDFPTGDITGKNTVYAYDTIVNPGQNDFDFWPITFESGDSTAFTIDSIATYPLVGGERRAIKFGFHPKGTLPVWAAMHFGDDCVSQDFLLRGTGEGPGFTVTGKNFGTVLRDSTRTDTIFVTNTSAASPLTVTGVTIDSSDFSVASVIASLAIAPGTRSAVLINFRPSNCGARSATVNVTSSEAGTHNASLRGIGDCAGVAPTHTLRPPTVTSEGGRMIRITLDSLPPVTAHLDVCDIVGRIVLSVPVTQRDQLVDATELRDGIYLYKLVLNGVPTVAKLVIWS